MELSRFRRSLLLVLGSLVIPGSAQLIAGNRRFGRIALGVWLGLVVIGGLIVWQVPLTELAKWVVRPAVLTSFKVVAIVLALGWVAVIVDAWRLGDPPALARKHRLTMVGVTVAVAALIATPFVYATNKLTAAHDAVVAMFPSGEVAAASDGRLNILLLGADAGDGRSGVRPDSIMLVSVDVQTGEPAMISLPRNLEKARFAEGTPAAAEFPAGFTGEGDRSNYMLNATWTYGEANPEMFPGPAGPGPTAVKQAVEGTLGVNVHYYVAIDLEGFKGLIDALGGITIRVEEDLVMGQSGKILEAGLKELNGSKALWYARSRTGSSDYARMSRQRCVIGAILNEADPATVVANFEDLAAASESIVTTDIPREDLGNLVGLAAKAKDHDFRSLQFVPPLITSADPDFGLIREQTESLLSGEVADEPVEEKADDATADEGTGGSDDVVAAGESSADAVPEDDEAVSGEGEAAAEEDDPSEPVAVDSVCSYE
jgi:polyisoprenyl-teichoic acid--peptidoglycan teichoic acid transferase